MDRKDYSKGKIYKLVNDVNDQFYVGSTTTTLAKRKYWHKGRQLPGVKAVFDVIGWDQLKIILVEKWPCADNDELRQRERYWYDKLKPTMNCVRPWVSDEERKQEAIQRSKQYYEQNKDVVAQKARQYREANKERLSQKAKQYREANKVKIAKQSKQYREANKEKIAERGKHYYEQNKDKIARYRENNKCMIAQQKKKYDKQYREANKEKIAQRAKQYREANKERLAQRAKQYREANKERLAERDKQYRDRNRKRASLYHKQWREANKHRLEQRVTCECGSAVRRNGLKRHERSSKHINWFYNKTYDYIYS
jgi:flagellar biosynthesis GTPase FlhF